MVSGTYPQNPAEWQSTIQDGIGLVKLSRFQVCAAQVGPIRICSLQVGLTEVGPPQNSCLEEWPCGWRISRRQPQVPSYSSCSASATLLTACSNLALSPADSRRSTSRPETYLWSMLAINVW